MTLYERFNPGVPIQGGRVYGTTYRGQTFTIGCSGTNENHWVSHINFKTLRTGSPGLSYFYLYTTDVNHHPLTPWKCLCLGRRSCECNLCQILVSFKFTQLVFLFMATSNRNLL